MTYNFICNYCNNPYTMKRHKHNDFNFVYPDGYACRVCDDDNDYTSLKSLYFIAPNIRIIDNKINYYYTPIPFNNAMYVIRGSNRFCSYETIETTVTAYPNFVKSSQKRPKIFEGPRVYDGPFFEPNINNAINEIVEYGERIIKLLVFI